jgi:Tfp pilus assembly protein PilE
MLMVPAAHPPNRPGRRGVRGESGFALVEVMVSAVLLIMLALATFPVIDQAAQRTGTNRSQGVASSIAQGDQQRMRQMTSTALANYRETRNQTVRGITYNIQSRADVVRDSSGIVACQTDTGRAEYFKISSTITWPAMNGVDPVVVESIIAPGVAALGLSTVTVKLTNAAGGPQPGIPVTAGTLSDSTDSGGCAVFAFVNPGTIPVGWSKSGYVDARGNQNVSQSVSATSTSTANVLGQYDLAAAAPVNFVSAADSTAARWQSISAVNAGPGYGGAPRTWSSSADPSPTGLLADKLFPYPSNAYAFYAGTCSGNDPRTYDPAFSTPNVLTSPGQTASAVSLPLRAVTVHVKSGTTANFTAARVRAIPDTSTSQMAACTTVADKGLAVTVNSSADATLYLPWGRWLLCAEKTSGTIRRNTAIVVGGTGRRTYNNVPPGTPAAVGPQDTSAGPFTADVASTASGVAGGTC